MKSSRPGGAARLRDLYRAALERGDTWEARAKSAAEDVVEETENRIEYGRLLDAARDGLRDLRNSIARVIATKPDVPASVMLDMERWIGWSRKALSESEGGKDATASDK